MTLDWKWIVEKVGIGTFQLVVIVILGLFILGEIKALRTEMRYEIAMLRSNDIEHLRIEMTAGFDALKKQNEALVYTLVKNKQLSESDAEYIKGIAK
ncbi:MAG: hypothetical protein LBR38_03750 [Synergistaceae bacterium]|jgi:hypothetical protein|nr:hypothetical protein [Synergistaceae bacterium]